MTRFFLGLSLAACVAGPVTAGTVLPGTAPDDLTGVWVGQVKCKVFDGEEMLKPKAAAAFTIDHDGSTRVAVATEFLEELPLPGQAAGADPFGDVTLCGAVLARKPTNTAVGVGTLEPIDGNDEVISRGGVGFPYSLQVMTIKTKTFAEKANGESGRLTGKGTLLSTAGVGTCTVKLTRVSEGPVSVEPFICNTL